MDLVLIIWIVLPHTGVLAWRPFGGSPLNLVYAVTLLSTRASSGMSHPRRLKPGCTLV